jgi:REP element-mobilizing transposase RayT
VKKEIKREGKYMQNYQNKHNRQTTRLQTWDYASDGAYFITICTKNRQQYFGKIKDRKMHLSECGIIADVFWHEIKHHAKNIELGQFVVMPNHIHGILILRNNEEYSVGAGHALPIPNRFQNPGKNSISTIVGSYKSAVSKHAYRLGFEFEWQTRFHDRIIRDEQAFLNISNYIINNPKKWEEDELSHVP